MLEPLCQDPCLALSVGGEIPVAPDFTPPFFPGGKEDLSAPTWAWRRFGALELAILHRRVDTAVLLVRLGANMLHTVDHVSVLRPDHYSITDQCFVGLTPLHLCALLDLRVMASALLNEAGDDRGPVVAGAAAAPPRQALLSATCAQCPASLEDDGKPGTMGALWLWRDL